MRIWPRRADVRWLTRLLEVVALLKSVIALLSIPVVLSTTGIDASVPYLVRAAVVASFAGTGAVLLVGGRRDARARSLAVVFLLVASVFADALLQLFVGGDATLTAARAIFALQVDAFTPFYVWRFTSDFLRPGSRVGRRVDVAAQVTSLALGTLLFVANLVVFALSHGDGTGGFERTLSALSRHGSAELYWPAQFVLFAAALAVLAVRARRASGEERRRAALLVWSLVACTSPTVMWLLIYTLAGSVARRFLPFEHAAWVIYPTLLSTPVATAYAVLVRHALDVRLVVRRALQYALARYSAIALAAAPLLLLVVLAYGRRDRSVAELAASGDVLLLLALAAGGLLLLRGRRGLLDRLDRRFFRRQYDARATLTALVDGCRTAATTAELAHVLGAEIDRALQLESVAVLFLDRDGARYAAPGGVVRPLDRESALAGRLAAGALEIDERGDVLGEDGVPLRDADRHWIADVGVRLLLPLRAADRSLLGVLALGDKRSDLPYSAEDRMLLAAVTAAAELRLAHHGLRPTAAQVGAGLAAPAEPVVECLACGALYDDAPEATSNAADACARCGGALRAGALPRELGDRFRLEARLGAGGMGVVYRATDLALGRPVALKTLPFLGPGESLRLRREARAMALVSHANLALIFGAESWYGRPILICEYLPGGTLAERLARGPLPPDAAIELGVALAGVLGAIHAAGLLHRDVKPNNIGFADDGRPKLLDFGLARILDGALPHAALDSARPDGARRGASGAGSGAMPSVVPGETGSVLLGTPLYMSPEALVGEPPDAAFDLWSLAVVLYEAVAARHPFRTAAGEIDRRRILTAGAPDVRTAAPEASAALAAFLRVALARDPADRYGTPAAFAAALRELRVVHAHR